MLTNTLLSYRLSRWKLVMAYLALVPLIFYAVFEYFLGSHKGNEWYFGIIVILALLAVGSTFGKWARFVTELHATEVGIGLSAILGGNRDFTWSHVKSLRALSGIADEFAALQITDEKPFYLYMGEETREQFVSPKQVLESGSHRI